DRRARVVDVGCVAKQVVGAEGRGLVIGNGRGWPAAAGEDPAARRIGRRGRGPACATEHDGPTGVACWKRRIDLAEGIAQVLGGGDGGRGRAVAGENGPPARLERRRQLAV